MLNHIDELLSKLTLSGLRRWASFGAQAYRRDFNNLTSYFNLESADSRETLHQSVVCKIRFYHFAADKIMNKTLEAMELVLGEKLSDDLPDSISHILNFKKK